MIANRKNTELSPIPLSRAKTPEINWKVYHFSPSYPAPSKVQKLVKELSERAGIARVRAVNPQREDTHWIEIELELQAEIDLSYETWDTIQDLVINCVRDLRKQTGEKWYLHTKVVEKFSRIQEGTQLLLYSSEKGLSDMNLSSSISEYPKLTKFENNIF